MPLSGSHGSGLGTMVEAVCACAAVPVSKPRVPTLHALKKSHIIILTALNPETTGGATGKVWGTYLSLFTARCTLVQSAVLTPTYANGHISATGDPIHFMFGSRVGFSGTADRTALFTILTNPRWRPPPCWKNFKWRYLRNRSSDPRHVLF